MTFEEQLEQIKNHTLPKRDMIYVCDTSTLLQEIGLDNLPIMMTQKHLYTITHKEGKYKDVNYHNLSFSIIKQIPEQLNEPQKILQSNTKTDSIVIVTNLKDYEGRKIIVSMKYCGTGRKNNIWFHSNVITSIYGRNDFDKFIMQNKNHILYDKKEGIIKKLSGVDRVQFPMSTNSTNDSISKNKYPVNSYDIPNDENNTIKDDTLKYGYYVLEIIII